MNTLQAKYFIALCREQSFSKAAASLFVTQPSFSQFIKKIEMEVGAELVDRRCSPVKLTEAGKAYYNACLQFSAIEEDMMSVISNITELKTGHLSIGAEPFRASAMLSKSIAAFKKEYGGVEISIAEASQKRLERYLYSGEIDLAICSGEINDDSIHCEVLADENMYMAVPEDAPINSILSASRVTYEDIAGNSLHLLKVPKCDVSVFKGLPYISLEQGESISDIADSIFLNAAAVPDIIVRVRNLNTAISLVLEGMGMTIVPDTVIKYGNMLRHPCYYAIKSPAAVNRINLLTKRNRYLSRAAEEYSKILKQLIMSGTWRI